MKVNDILNEETTNKNLEKSFEKIINSNFFKTYYDPTFKEIYSELLNPEDLFNDEDYGEYVIQEYRDNLELMSLYHGAKGKSDIGIYDFEYRKKPKDTDKFIHDYINEHTMEKFNEPIRNLFYTTRREMDAAAYGTSYYVIPLGDTRYYFHPKVDDLTSEYGANDGIDVGRMTQLIYTETDIEEVYPDVRDKVVIPILNHIVQYGIEKEFIESFVNDNFDLIEDEKEKLIDIIHNVIERDLEMFDNYIDNIEQTTNHLDIPPKSEIMMKTEKIVLIDSKHFEDLIEYYHNNYLKQQ